MIEEYSILKNSEIFYKIFINNKTKTIKLYQLNDNTLVLNVKHFDKIFIGKSKKNKLTSLSKGFGKKYDGNSILIKLKENTYLFIGQIIYYFTIDEDEEILSFYSPIGNNLLPYPYAISNKNVFFLIESKKKKLEDFPIKINKSINEDLYYYFYTNINKSYKIHNIKYAV